MCPPRSLENASRVPSGDHAGSSSTAESFVICTGVPPTGSTQRSPIAVNAMLRPSGETMGLTMPASRCGSAGSSTRCAIGKVLRWSETLAENGMTVAAAPGTSDRCLMWPSAV